MGAVGQKLSCGGVDLLLANICLAADKERTRTEHEGLYQAGKSLREQQVRLKELTLTGARITCTHAAGASLLLERLRSWGPEPEQTPAQVALLWSEAKTLRNFQLFARRTLSPPTTQPTS